MPRAAAPGAQARLRQKKMAQRWQLVPQQRGRCGGRRWCSRVLMMLLPMQICTDTKVYIVPDRVVQTRKRTETL